VKRHHGKKLVLSSDLEKKREYPSSTQVKRS